MSQFIQMLNSLSLPAALVICVALVVAYLLVRHLI